MKAAQTVRAELYRAVLRRKGTVFQTKDIREDCGWSEEAPEARKMHAIIQSLKRDGILKQTGTARRRHQYLMLERPDELQARLGRAAPRESTGNGKVEDGASLKPGPQRVRYLEERVHELEDRSRSQDGKLDDVLGVLAKLTTKIDDLHREWVGV